MKKLALLLIMVSVFAGIAFARYQVIRDPNNQGGFVVLDYEINPYTNTEDIASSSPETLDFMRQRLAQDQAELTTDRSIFALAMQISMAKVSTNSTVNATVNATTNSTH